jgi:hypothetical protein
MTAGSEALAAVSAGHKWGPCILVQCIALNIRLLLALLKECAENEIPQGTDMCRIK